MARGYVGRYQRWYRSDTRDQSDWYFPFLPNTQLGESRQSEELEEQGKAKLTAVPLSRSQIKANDRQNLVSLLRTKSASVRIVKGTREV